MSNDVVRFPDGAIVPVADVVAVLRRGRGRLTRRDLCTEVGLDPNDPRAFRIVNTLCQRYEITTADPGRCDPMASRRAHGDLQRAKDALANEIRAARAEWATSPPYRGE